MNNRVGIIVASDTGSQGKRIDLSGKKIAEMMSVSGYVIGEICILPDDIEQLKAKMIEMVDSHQYALVLTTGGTGFSMRDNTPEATLAVIERATPGISEAMRWVSYQKTPKAILSRAVSGIRKYSLIINLPGSPKAVEECLSAILEPLKHGIEILQGEATRCGEEVPPSSIEE